MSYDGWPVGVNPADYQLVASYDITDETVLRAVFGDDLIDLALSARGARLKPLPLAVDGHAYRRRQKNRVKRRRR